MSGDGHTNETRELNLDDIEARADITDTAIVCGSGALTEVGRREARRLLGEDVPALVAEVRTLRDALGEVSS